MICSNWSHQHFFDGNFFLLFCCMNLALGSKTHHCIYFQKNLPARWWCLDSLHWITRIPYVMVCNVFSLIFFHLIFSLSSFSIIFILKSKTFSLFHFHYIFSLILFSILNLENKKKNENRNKKRRKDSLYSLTLTCSFPNSSSHPQLSWFIHWNPHPSIHIHKHMNFLHFFFFLFSLECLLISKFSFYLLFFLK